MSASPDSDPFDQSVTFHYGDGSPFNVSTHELNEFVLYNTKVCINYGTQFGASLLLLIILALMTRPDRRKSAVCILNAGALLFNAARLLCMSLYFTSPFSDVYAFFAFDYSRVPDSAYANSILGVVFTLFLLICLEASLVIQVYVICTTTRPLYRHLVLAVSLVFALVAIGFRIAVVVENSQYIVDAIDFSPMVWLQSASNICITVSICFFSSVFIIKLGFAIRQRRQLGFKKFGPMQVIFIMGCQTMIVPAICSIIQHFTEAPELGTNVLTLVAISLPLSSMWATSALENNHENTLPTGKFWGSSSNSSTSNSTSTGGVGVGVGGGVGGGERKFSAATSLACTQCSLPAMQQPPSKNLSASNIDRHSNLYPDLEAGDAIHVDRKFSVASWRQ